MILNTRMGNQNLILFTTVMMMLFPLVCLAGNNPLPLSLLAPSETRPDLPQYLPEEEGTGFILPPVPEIPEEPLPAGGGIILKKVVFKGNTMLTDPELCQTASPFIGRRVGIAELEDLRRQITRRYIDLGFINSGAVILPGQDVSDGVVTYTVREGRISHIKLTGNGRLRSDYITRRLWPDFNQPFNIKTLQDRFQMLLQDPLIHQMHGRILPGTDPEHAALDVDVIRKNPFSITAGVDNHRSPSTAAERGTISGWVRNLTGWGDALDGSLGISEGAHEYAAAYSIPLTYQNTRLALRYSYTESAVIEEPLNTLDVESETRHLGVSLFHPIFQNLQETLELGITLDVRKSKTFLLGDPYSFSSGAEDGESKVNVLRFIQTYSRRSQQSAFTCQSTFSYGIDLFDPTRHDGDIPDNVFLTWLGQVQYARRISDKLGQLILRGDLQLARDRLLSLEQFSVGGANTVRGYRENTFVRDNGYTASLEWRLPLFKTRASKGYRDLLQIAGFMDVGAAWNKNENANGNRLHSAGVGLIFTPCSRLNAQIYWAHDIKEAPPTDHYDLQDDGIHFMIQCNALSF